MSQTKAQLREDNERLRRIAADLHWMARRYADGRSTYAPGIVNDATRYLILTGVPLNIVGERKLFARDGDDRIAAKEEAEFERIEAEYIERRKKELSI